MSQVKENIVPNKGKNSKKKTPNFVPLNGLSQSAKDRQMNKKKVRPPKNLNLVEGEPCDKMKSQRRPRSIEAFPNEHLLSSKIKEVNGMDYSNHSIEQYYRHCHSRSDSPEVSEDSTNSSSLTNSSIQSGSQEEAFVPNVNSSTGAESSITESDLPADRVINSEEYTSSNQDYNQHFIDSEELDEAIRNFRYSKNAAIIGLLRQNMISMQDLGLDSEHNQAYYSEDDVGDVQYPSSNAEGETLRNMLTKNDSARKSDSEPNRIPDYPHLVPHPEDDEFYTHPLQAYGKVDDAGIDFTLARIGKKTVITPKQHFINEALNDDKFTFQKPTLAAAKPKPKINIPKVKPSQSPRDKNYCDVDGNNSLAPVNDENDGFRLNREEFPTLHR